MLVDSFLGVDQSPVLSLYGSQNGLSGVKQRINHGAYDMNGDSLSYTIITLSNADGEPLATYSHPNSDQFYTVYAQGNAANDSIPTYSIDPVSGDIQWMLLKNRRICPGLPGHGLEKNK